jgi:hypothetical protein
MRARVLTAVTAMGVALVACAAVFEDAVQCKTDGDCAAFPHTRCDPVERVCVKRGGAPDASAPVGPEAGPDATDAAPAPVDASDAAGDAIAEAETAPIVTYLSDLTPATVTNGFGPYEKDTSNGEDLAGDGVTITLETVTYAKGLGVHAPSEITYALGGAYATFIADVGVDDEAMANGSVVFQVLLDDVVVFDSGTMTGATATKNVSVSTAGKQVLKLVVTDAADGVAFDHADWAGARLLK